MLTLVGAAIRFGHRVRVMADGDEAGTAVEPMLKPPLKRLRRSSTPRPATPAADQS